MLSGLILAAVTGYANVPPVTVASCQIEIPAAAQQGDSAVAETIGGYSLHVHFSDTASEPISKVVFHLNDGTNVSDLGTFSPGVSIDHMLPLKVTNATSCTADSAVLADGTQISLSMP